jgi:hypothetical protein
VVKYELARLGGSMPMRRFKPKSPATASWLGRPMELIRPGPIQRGTAEGRTHVLGASGGSDVAPGLRRAGADCRHCRQARS